MNQIGTGLAHAIRIPFWRFTRQCAIHANQLFNKNLVLAHIATTPTLNFEREIACLRFLLVLFETERSERTKRWVSPAAGVVQQTNQPDSNINRNRKRNESFREKLGVYRVYRAMLSFLLGLLGLLSLWQCWSYDKLRLLNDDLHDHN